MTEMVFCAACGAQLTAEARFCAACGAAQEDFRTEQNRPADGSAGPMTIATAVVAALAVVLLLATVLTGRSGPLALISFLLASGAIAYAGWRANSDEGSREVNISPGSTAKVRSFWMGFALSLLTIGVYGLFWYYFVNDELKDVGAAKGDENLAQSNPAMSVTAIFVGGWLILPPFLSIYNYGQRIKRAERLGGIPTDQQISPVLAFLLYFPGMLLVIPYFVHFWYVTNHQNAALRTNSQRTPGSAPVRGVASAKT